MTDHEFDDVLKNALSSQEKPSEILNGRIRKQAKEIEMKKRNQRKKWMSMAAAAAIFLGVSTTAVAAYHLLKAPDVAEELAYDFLKEPFEKEDILNNEMKQQSGPYEVTLLGMVSGEQLDESFLGNFGLEAKEHMYTAVAIARTDGESMEQAEGTDFFISPLIQGLNPYEYNLITMHGGITWNVIDGVMYYIVDCDDITCFADRNMYMAVLDRTFYSVEAYQYDEATGEISRNNDYSGMNLLFDLPADRSLANPQRAEQFIKELEEEWNQESSGPVSGEEAQAVAEAEQAMIEKILQNGSLREDSVKEVTKSRDGFWVYEYYGAGEEMNYSSDMPFSRKIRSVI